MFLVLEKEWWALCAFARSGFLLVIIGLLSSAVAQQEPFSNSSLNGTYALFQITAGANQPAINLINATVNYFDGEGNHRLAFIITNRAGETDAEGNPTRISQRNLSDSSTQSHTSGTYEVFPFGAFFLDVDQRFFWDGLVTGTVMIDGVLTISEFKLFGRVPQGATGGGVAVWHGSRITDVDVVPPVPE